MENVSPTRTLMTFEGSVKPPPGEADADGAGTGGDAESAGEGAGEAISPIEIRTVETTMASYRRACRSIRRFGDLRA
jgi:hypothetical protein